MTKSHSTSDVRGVGNGEIVEAMDVEWGLRHVREIQLMVETRWKADSMSEASVLV